MADMKFTPAQQNAIDASGGSVIVSAGAGSGKTRVLVQRVIRLLTDQEHPVDADRLLIVTFTKAAAEEMRSRIASAIEKRLFYEPDNVALRRQQLLLCHRKPPLFCPELLPHCSGESPACQCAGADFCLR